MVRRALLILSFALAAHALPFYPPRSGAGSATGGPSVVAGAHVILVAWNDLSCNGVCAVRFSDDGQLLDATPHAISGAPGARLLAMASDGETFLTAQTTGGDAMLVKVDGDGSSRLVALRGHVNGLALAWDGSAYLVAETYDRFVQMARVRPDGSLVEGSTETLSSEGSRNILAAANDHGTVVLSWTPMSAGREPVSGRIHFVREFPFPSSIVTNGRGFLAGQQLLDENGTFIWQVTWGAWNEARAWNGRDYVALAPHGSDLTYGVAATPFAPALVPLPQTAATVTGTGLARLSGNRMLFLWSASSFSGVDGSPIQRVFAGVYAGTLSDIRPISNGPAPQFGATTATCGETAVVAWMERGEAMRVRVGRVRRDGTLVDHDALAVDPNVRNDIQQFEPVVACNATSFAVAWKERSSATGPVALKAAFFPSATPEVSRVATISSHALAQRLTGLASDGERYLVAWRDAGDPRISGARFSRDGVAIDPFALSLNAAATEEWSLGGDNGVVLRWDGEHYAMVWEQMTAPLQLAEIRFALVKPDLVMDGPSLDINALPGLLEWPLDARLSLLQTPDGWFVREYALHADARVWLSKNGAIRKAFTTRNVTRKGADNFSVACDGLRALTIDDGAITARDQNDGAAVVTPPEPVAALAGFQSSLPLVLVSQGAAFAVRPAGAHGRLVGR